MTRPLSILGAPSSAGAYAPGQEKAPAAFRRHGLAGRLRETGRPISDLGDVDGFRWRPDRDRPAAMNLEAVLRTAEAVRDRVAPALRSGGAALVLGGDCTVELGVVAAAVAGPGSVGLVYIDGDADLNTPATAEGALDWTGLAHALDLPGTLHELSGLGPRRPMLDASQVMLFGAHEITPPEAEAIRTLGIAHEPIETASADAAGAAARAAAWAAGFDRLLVHVDVDVLAFTRFPISENVRFGRRDIGLALADLATVLATLARLPNWRTMTLAEINPDHAPDETASFNELIDMLAHALRPASTGAAAARS